MRPIGQIPIPVLIWNGILYQSFEANDEDAQARFMQRSWAALVDYRAQIIDYSVENSRPSKDTFKLILRSLHYHHTLWADLDDPLPDLVFTARTMYDTICTEDVSQY